MRANGVFIIDTLQYIIFSAFSLYLISKITENIKGPQGLRMKNVYTEKKRIYIKKAEREAAAMPPSRSDRWQAKFRRNFAQSDSNYGQPRRTAGLLPGVQPIFYGTVIFGGI